MSTPEKNPIMLVDDDYIDRMTVIRALKDSKIKSQPLFAGNGQEALDLLNKEETEKPSLILLDLNMPVMDGLEFLQIIKADDKFKDIPVVVLTTSNLDNDRTKAYQNKIAGYFVKPSNYLKFIEMFESLKQYWRL